MFITINPNASKRNLGSKEKTINIKLRNNMAFLKGTSENFFVERQKNTANTRNKRFQQEMGEMLRTNN